MCTNLTKKAFDAVLPYNDKSYSTFLDLLNSATPYVSCLGVYRVSLKGYKGSTSLWQIENLVVELIHANSKFNETKRKMGESITQKINAFNVKCGQIVKKKSCFKRLIYKIVKIFLSIFRCQSLYRSKYHDYFNFSSPSEMFSEFPDLTVKEVNQVYKMAVSAVRKKGDKFETVERTDLSGNKIVETRKQKNNLNKSIQLVAEKYKEFKVERPKAPFQFIMNDLTRWANELPVTNF